MKKLLFGLLIAASALACNSDNATTDGAKNSSAPMTPGLDNVDGNIPDSNRTMQLNRPLPSDSTTVDSSTSQPKKQ